MHPKVLEAYNEAGFQVPSTPQDARELQFRRKTKRAREGEIKKFINQVYRISQGPNKDYIFYEEKEVGPDIAGNEDTYTEQKGRYDMPKFRRVYDPSTGDVQAVQLAGSEMVYEIQYSKAKMQEILDSGDSSNTAFTLIVGNRKYGGFTADDFINKSFDELAEMALTGDVGTSIGKTTIGQLRQQEAETVAKAKERLKQHQEEERAIAEEAKRIREERLQQGKGEGEGGGGLGPGSVETTSVKEDIKPVLRRQEEAAAGGVEDEEEEPTFKAAGEEEATPLSEDQGQEGLSKKQKRQRRSQSIDA